MSWARPHLYGVETLDQQVHRLREEADPYPGVSSLDEARADRHRNLSPEPSRVLLLRSASPSLGKDGSVPVVPASRLGGNRAARGPRDPHDDGPIAA